MAHVRQVDGEAKMWALTSWMQRTDSCQACLQPVKTPDCGQDAWLLPCSWLLFRWFLIKLPRKLEYFTSSQEWRVRKALRCDCIKFSLSFFSISCMNNLSAGGGKLSQARQQELRIFSLWIQEADIFIFRAALSGTLQLLLLTAKCHQSLELWSPNSHIKGSAHQQWVAAKKQSREWVTHQ